MAYSYMKLKADFEDGTGSISKTACQQIDQMYDEHGIIALDIMKDWFEEIAQLYNEKLADFNTPKAFRSEEKVSKH